MLGFCDSNQIQDHEEDESSVGQKWWMHGVWSITRGAEKLLSWAECWKHAAEFYAWRGALRFLREVGFGMFLAGYT